MTNIVDRPLESLLDFSVTGSRRRPNHVRENPRYVDDRGRIEMDPIRETALPVNTLELALLSIGDYGQTPEFPLVRFDDYEDEYEDDFEEEDDFDDFSEEEEDFDEEEDDFDDEEDDDFDDDFDEEDEESSEYDYEDDIDYNDFDE